MLAKLRKQTQGFTIIEVLIVLAIAGLIILIVFLAVPALQRNSRNTNRRNDVSKMLGALQEAVNNNNGQFPNSTCFGGQDTCWLNGLKNSFYSDASDNLVYFYNATVPATAPTGPTGGQLDVVHIVTAMKCDSNQATVDGATARTAVALYRVEVSGKDDGQLICTES